MLASSVCLHNIWTQAGLVECIYKAMCKNDLSDVVITTLKIMKWTNTLPSVTKEVKSKEKSKKYELEADAALEAGDRRKALELYNLALMYVPIKSNEMKLIYCKRSAVFLNMKSYAACLKDVEICLLLGSCIKIDKIIYKIQSEALKCNIYKERIETDMVRRGILFRNEPTEKSKTFFKFNVNRNSDIPCASTSIEVQFESRVPKIVASTNIKTGTVLAIETPFVSRTNVGNSLYSCHYCQKINLNLIPCEGCCFALFCDDKCMKLCFEEYHHVECQIIHLLHFFSQGNVIYDLAFKGMLKMKNMCTWDEFITESNNYGNSRIMKSSVRELYDMKYNFSLLNCKEDKPSIFGEMFNYCPIAAIIISALDNVQSFLPQTSAEKTSAIKAVSRMLMYLVLFSIPIEMVVVPSVDTKNLFNRAKFNYGLFSFTGKLNNSHLANVVPVALSKNLALVAVQPIKKGDELMIPYWGFWISSLMTPKNLLLPQNITCNCILCSESWKLEENHGLTDTQRNALRELDLIPSSVNINLCNLFGIYDKICKALTILNDRPYTNEYIEVFKLFKLCILHFQIAENMYSNKY